MAQKAKPAPQKTAADPAVENLQRELKQQGFYSGPIDGLMGETTKDAVAARDAKAKADADREIEKLRLQNQGVTAGAEAEALASKTRAREERQRLASSPLGIATETAAGAPAALGGVAIGRGMGLGINALMDASQASKNAALAGVAADRTAGLTTRDGALAAAARSGALPSENPLLRVGGRMLPHLALGGFMAGKGGVLLSQENPEGAFYPEMFNRGAGLAMLGAGTGIAERGITYGVSPGVAPDAKAMAVIGSNQLRRNGVQSAGDPQAAPAPRQVTPGSRPDLMAQAKRYEIKGRTKMTTDQLREAVGEAVKANPAPRGGAAVKRLRGLAGPAAAAGLAYSLTPDRAEAADGSAIAGEADALANAGIAGGVAYGASRALPKSVGTVLGMAGDALAPSTIDTITDEFASPDARNWAARNFPSWARAGAVESAYQMAQVPERNPLLAAPAAPDPFDEALGRFESFMGNR